MEKEVKRFLKDMPSLIQLRDSYGRTLLHVAVWGNQLTAAQASAMYHAGKDLQYNAKDIASLFAVFAGGQGSMTNTSDRKKWVYAIGLTGSAGAVVKNFTALVLDGAGNGVRILSAGTTIEVK